MQTAPERGRRSPHIAAVLSFLLPGLGQWYGGRVRAAALFALPVLGIALALLTQVVGGVGQIASLLLTPSSALTILILIGLLAVWRLLAIADSMAIDGVREPLRHRRTLTTFVILAALVLGMHGVMGYAAWAFYDASSRIFVDEHSPDETSPPASASALAGATAAPSDDYVAAPVETPPTLDSRINVLLTGVDSDPGRSTALTDTLLVASLDPTTGDLVLISFPRDISDFELVDGRTFTGKINGFMTWVKNHPDEFEDKPLTELVKQLGFMLGAPIHYYAAIDLAGFRRMIDLVGGVTVNNTEVINDPRYDWLDGRRGFYLSAGKHKLNGEKALAYVRSRRGAGDSDFGRARRQQQVLLALRAKLTKPDMLPELPGILDAAGDTVRTNFPSDRVAEMIDLAQRVQTDDVRQIVLAPNKYATRPPYSETGGIYKLRLKEAALAKLSIDIFGPASRYYSMPGYAPTASPNSLTPTATPSAAP